MFSTQLRKVGNSWVTVPRDELERLGIEESATVLVEIRQARVTVEPLLAADLREPAARALAKSRRGLRYLA
jgi:antitoxin component of MazEF toxin-antitoxin module